MSKVIKLKKGLDINLKGKAENALSEAPGVAEAEISIKPSDFPCMKPALKVKEGDKVKAGSVLFTDKYRPEICFCSPVSGTVAEIRRAERRRITDIVVKGDGAGEYEKFDTANVNSKDAAKELLLKSGVWPYLRQRPFNIIADPQSEFKAVYVSTFDSAPLAPDYQFILKDQVAEFQAGVDILGKIAPVYLGLDAKVKDNIFAGVKCKEINSFDGPHPAGNAGVQISHIIPVNKGENVIVVNPQDVAIIGRLVKNGIYDAKKTVVIAGSKVNKPQYIKTIANTSVAPLINGNIDADNARIISGNVLTGTKIDEKGFLGFYD
ncbi:MAG: NADH:ubiquinone reductase (Na(+)-transporting) subunit A, partial [Bacteroidales bacterium]|nr:NADH:ubiquinone reductase (Na(+)-transporting) subunit A [Bacteroidales bacterium]